MITITRRLAQQLRSVLRRAFGNFRGNGPAIGFIADKAGLLVKSIYGDVAVECRLPGNRPTETLWLPFEFLADVAGKNDTEVDLELSGDGQISVQWRTGNVPQIVKYDAKEPFAADKFPVLPTAFTSNPVGLLQALDAAAEVTAHEGVRYAIDCIQLSPDGTINATDGRQALIQSGFTFPWPDAVLVPRNKVFTCAELPQDQPAAVARSGDWVAVSAGRWTVYLRITASRYPKVSRIVPDPDTAKTRCQFSKDDIRFLVETLPHLPCEDENHFPVTIDLNGQIVIRARPAEKEEEKSQSTDNEGETAKATDGEKAKPTEVVLTNSRCTGEPVRINIEPGVLAAGDEARPSRLVSLRRQLCFALPELRSQVCLDAAGARCRNPGHRRCRPHRIAPRRDRCSHFPIRNPKGTSAHERTDNQHDRQGRDQRPGQIRHHGSEGFSPQGRPAGPRRLDRPSGEVPHRSARPDARVERPGEGPQAHRRQNQAIENTLASLKQLKTLGV